MTKARAPNHVTYVLCLVFSPSDSFVLGSSHLGITLHVEQWWRSYWLEHEEDSGKAQLRVHTCKECLMCCCGQPVKSDYFSTYLKGIWPLLWSFSAIKSNMICLYPVTHFLHVKIWFDHIQSCLLKSDQLSFLVLIQKPQGDPVNQETVKTLKSVNIQRFWPKLLN